MLHQWFYKKCKVLIFSVYFCGARCSYIYIYSCTLHQPERGVPIGLGGFVLALQGFGRWVAGMSDLGQSWGFYSILCPFRSM